MNKRLEELNRLYDLLDRETQRFALACKADCPACCTVNVTATSLEVAYVLACLDEAETGQMAGRLRDLPPGPRFVPKTTVNGFARACMTGADLPEEENDPAWGACPFLAQGRCTIYRARPLGCRVMVSETPCGSAGFARMPDLALTLAQILQQTVEQMDLNGFSGNFLDVLAAGLKARPPAGRPGDLSLDNLPDFDRKGIFLENQPIPALMVPPEHRAALAPLIREIRQAANPGNDV